MTGPDDRGHRVWKPPIGPLTREALSRTSGDYVSKEVDEYALIEELKARHGLDRVYRFDIGKNTDGYSDLIEGVLELTDLADLCRQHLIEYPDNHCELLVEHMADRFGLDPGSFVITSGLECMIDHVCRVFLHPEAEFLLPVPNFSVFENFSLRVGGRPIYLPLREKDGFLWTGETVARLREAMAERSPALLWISNPVNPTGQHLSPAWIEELVTHAEKHETVVVVDEAYGEYTDPEYGFATAADLTPRRPNLLVMRTFSKIHALPSLRVGYLTCSDPDVIGSLELYRPMFPLSWFSLFVAQIAFVDEEQAIKAREKTEERKAALYQHLDGLPAYEYIPSAVNTVMLRHTSLSADELWEALAARGCLTANLNGVNGLAGEEFLRITVRAEDENLHLVGALEDIAEAANP